jgi:hypothetical protein
MLLDCTAYVAPLSSHVASRAPPAHAALVPTPPGVMLTEIRLSRGPEQPGRIVPNAVDQPSVANHRRSSNTVSYISRTHFSYQARETASRAANG